MNPLCGPAAGFTSFLQRIWRLMSSSSRSSVVGLLRGEIKANDRLPSKVEIPANGCFQSQPRPGSPREPPTARDLAIVTVARDEADVPPKVLAHWLLTDGAAQHEARRQGEIAGAIARLGPWLHGDAKKLPRGLRDADYATAIGNLYARILPELARASPNNAESSPPSGRPLRANADRRAARGVLREPGHGDAFRAGRRPLALS